MKLWKFDQAIELIKTAIHKEDETHVTEMTGFLQRALIEKDNEMMGVRIVQLVCGKDIAIQKSVLNPIQNKLYEFASHMKNIIHVIVDIESKQCILVDAVNFLLLFLLFCVCLYTKKNTCSAGI